MKFKKVYYIAFVFAGLQSCEPFVEKFHTIELQNNSSQNILFTLGTIGEAFVYPDTIIPLDKTKMSLAPLEAGYNTYIGRSPTWEERISYLPKDTLSFYIFAEDTINSYPWEVISTEYKVLKRYDFSVQDLEMLNYKISYPPTEQMKNVRMYPPYEGN